MGIIMIKIGFIGCGWIVEKAHIPAFQKLEDVCIQALYDIDSERVRYISDKFDIPRIHSKLEEFLKEDIDAVVISSPNNMHTIHSDEAIKAGKHVLCEKPVAFSAKNYKETLEIAAQYNKLVIPAFVNRFRTDITKLNSILASDDFGELISIDAKWMRKSGIPRPGTWITNRKEAGGGVLIDLGSHLLDICLLNISNKNINLTKVYDMARDMEMGNATWCENGNNTIMPADVETSLSGEIEFNNKVNLMFSLSWNSAIEGDYTTFNFIFEKGRVVLDTLFGFSTNRLNRKIKLHVQSENKKEDIVMNSESTCAMKAFERQAKHFIEAIKTGECTKVYPDDGYIVVKVIEQLYASVL